MSSSSALAARGHRIEDIELLVVSHQHMDHFGLASILARRSGAEVASLSILAPYLAAYGHETDLEDAFAAALMLRHGIPLEIATALRAVSAGFKAWGSAVEVTRPLRTAASCGCATGRCESCTAPATALRTPSSTTRSARCSCGRPSDRPHLLEPPVRPPAGKRTRPGGTASKGADHLHELA